MSAQVAVAARTGVVATGAMFAGHGQIRMGESALDLRDDGDVLVRLHGSGVCASNLPVWEGREWFNYPMAVGAPGHEGWGEVESVGDAVEDLAPGDRVVLLSQHAYASHDIAPASMVVPIPRCVHDQPIPGEPLACAMNILDRSDLVAGQWVAVVGVGFIGALLVQAAARRGARVIALTRRAWARDLALDHGAEFAIDSQDLHEAAGMVREITGGGCRRVIEAAGYQASLDLATSVCVEGGRLIIAGYHQDGLRSVDMQRWNWCGLDVINAHERDPAVQARGLRKAMHAVSDGLLDPFPLITHVLPMRELGRAFQLMRERPDGFLKAVVTP
jgi:threonine dehydrogenase-like Zn-dependent dehydrogenase